MLLINLRLRRVDYYRQHEVFVGISNHRYSNPQQCWLKLPSTKLQILRERKKWKIISPRLIRTLLVIHTNQMLKCHFSTSFTRFLKEKCTKYNTFNNVDSVKQWNLLTICDPMHCSIETKLIIRTLIGLVFILSLFIIHTKLAWNWTIILFSHLMR